MIVRNSVKSVLRSPVKSILFFLLILALATALTLGSALAGMCTMLINECKANYTTIAVIEFRGGRFPDKAVTDSKAAELRSKIDFESIAKLDFVEKIDENRSAIVSVPGFNMILAENSSAANAVVAVIRRNKSADKVVNCLYGDAVSESSLLHLHFPEGFEDEYGVNTTDYYLVTGFTDGKRFGVINMDVCDIRNLLAPDAGVDVGNNFCLNVGKDANLEEDNPEYRKFIDAAEAYRQINSSWFAVVTDDPGIQEPFVEREYSLQSGRLYTPEDRDTVCCLLPNTIADRMKITAGDTVKLSVLQRDYCSIWNSYWPGSEKSEKEDVDCLVTGVISTTSRETPLIYISKTGGTGDETGFVGYSLATLRIKNGTSHAKINSIKEFIPEGTDISVSDQGYSTVTEALTKLRNDALGVTAAALVATAAMLVLFAYVFVGRQADTAVTMFLMGTPVRSLVTYVSVAAAIILLPASAIGSAGAYILSGRLNDLISKTLAEGQSVLRLYSNSSLGIVEIIESNVSMPVWPGIVCAAGTTLFGLAACLVFLRISLKQVDARAYEQKKEKKEKKRVPQNAKPLKMSGPAKKYVLLSFLRGGVRSVAVPVVSALMALFVLVPAGAITIYERRLDELNEKTTIKGYLSDYGGKRRYDLVLVANMTDAMVDSEYFEDFHLSQCDPYMVKTVHTRNAGAGEGTEEWTDTDYIKDIPSGSFSRENFESNLLNGPKIFYTDSIGSTPEFFALDKVDITWLEGYGEDYFTNPKSPFTDRNAWRYTYSGWVTRNDPRELCVVAADAFLEKYGMKLGDEVTVLDSHDIVEERYKVIGSFRNVTAGEVLYTNLYNAHKLVPIKSFNGKGLPEGAQEYLLKMRESYSCCSFRLTDTSKIREAKEWLRQKGFSRVHTANFYRVYPILADEDYIESVEKLEKNIYYLKNVLPAIAVLVAIAGFAAAYLMAYRRRLEIATLRSIGETDARVFAIFATEQLIPALVGTGAGVLIWFILGGFNAYSALAAAFIAGFTVGTVISMAKMSKNNLLEVLSDKE